MRLVPLCLLLLVASCSGGETRGASRSAATSARPDPQSDADRLGREIYSLVDQAMSYRSAHRGRPPRSLRELGVDQLTPETSRTLTPRGRDPVVTVEFRNLDQHALKSCTGGGDVLEEASIRGSFTLTCTTTTGGSTTLLARR